MSVWRNIRRLVLERDDCSCRICGKENSGQVHHIIPKRSGGTDQLSNLVTLCGRCHMLLSPIPDHVIVKVWEIPPDKVSVERAKIEKRELDIVLLMRENYG